MQIYEIYYIIVICYGSSVNGYKEEMCNVFAIYYLKQEKKIKLQNAK